ncbi:hypothetical protein ABZZ36_05385 [Actinacidiphila glaucinigra]|uniref:hypothetical protein n=1 Tax=Actinacidiphila glaucinigra TaxID=235986 RepID=UPI0033AED5DC
MAESDFTATAAVPAALRTALAAVSPTIPGCRGAALLLLGHTCDATVRELVSLDIADLTARSASLVLKIRRQDGERDDLISLSPQRADPTNYALAATQKLLDSLRAAGRTDGPLFVMTDGYAWVTGSATQGKRPFYDPTGRLTAGAAANIVIRIGRAAGVEFNCDWTKDSLRLCFSTATGP